MIKTLFTLTLLSLLSTCSLALDAEIRVKVVQAYQNWFPNAKWVRFQQASYNSRLLDQLKADIHTLQLAEVEPGETHRYFIAPLHVRGRYDEFAMMYASNKNYFAAFSMPWEQNGPSMAKFEGIGVINGPKQVEVVGSFGNRIHLYTPDRYQILFHIP